MRHCLQKDVALAIGMSEQVFSNKMNGLRSFSAKDYKALAVGYGLGEQAPLGEQEAQTVTQEVRRTGDVKRLCLTVKTGGRIDAITCQVLDDTTGDLT